MYVLDFILKGLVINVFRVLNLDSVVIYFFFRDSTIRLFFFFDVRLLLLFCGYS